MDDQDLAAFEARATAWLDRNASRREQRVVAWGEGSDSTAVFHNLSDEDERALLTAAMAWQQRKFDAGFGAISWPLEFGGAGLPGSYQSAFDDIESEYDSPGHHEMFSVTLHLVAPTVAQFGTEEQKETVLPRFLRTSEMCCQLFSEPSAGSDLAGLATRATQDGDSWIIKGQKTWSSGARFADWGELICRSDPTKPKHAGQTAFIIPMNLPGITVVPIRQMSGGASFNEVFFDDVRVDDRYRLGGIGEGWKVALTTLGFERSTSGGDRGAQTVGASWAQLAALARWLEVNEDPLVRQDLADLYIRDRIRAFLAGRTAARTEAGGQPGPEASASKLMWTQWMTRCGDVAARILGPKIVADTGDWGTFAWTEHLLGAPGYRIAGGSDEVQRNIIGERVLGLPGEPRIDRNVPFNEVPR